MRRLGLALAMCVGLHAATTTISMTRIVAGDGRRLATGKIIIAATAAFTAASGAHVDTAELPVNVINGAFTIVLEPNDSGVPSGSQYVVTWHLDGAKARQERWMVPTTSATLTVGDVLVSTLTLPAGWLVQLGQLGRGGAATGQAPVWSGSSWAPGDVGGGITGAPSTWPAFSAVATSGAYGDLSGQPAAVTWPTLGGKPTTFAPELHAAAHATAGADPVTAAAIGAVDLAAKDQPNGYVGLDASGSLVVGTTVLTGFQCDGVTDITALVQAVIDAHPSGHIVIQPLPAFTGACMISNLTQHDDQWIELAPGTTMRMLAGSSGNMLSNDAITALRSLANCATTNGSATVTCADGAFTSSDVGRTINLANAGKMGNWDTTLISAVSNSTTITVAVPAQNTIASGGTGSIYKRNHNLTLSGGTWDRAAVIGTLFGQGLDMILYRHVDGLHIFDIATMSMQGKFSIDAGDSTDVLAENLHFNRTNSDGIHFDGPMNRVTVRHVSGVTTDDAVAFTPSSYPGYPSFADIAGSITNVLVEDVNMTSTLTVVKIIGGDGTLQKNITIRGIRAASAGVGVNCAEDLTGAQTLQGVTIEDVAVNVGGADIQCGGTGASEDLFIRNVRVQTLVNATQRVAIELGGSRWKVVKIDGLDIGGAGASNLYGIRSGAGSAGSIGAYELSNIRVVFSDSITSSLLAVAGPTGSITATNIQQTGGRNMFYTFPGYSLAPSILANSSCTNCSRLMQINGGAVDIMLNGVILTNLNDAPIYIMGGGTLTVRGAGVSAFGPTAPWTFYRQGTEVIHCINADLHDDISILAIAPGDRCWNTNAALGTLGEAGPVIAGSSGWHLMADTTKVY